MMWNGDKPVNTIPKGESNIRLGKVTKRKKDIENQVAVQTHWEWREQPKPKVQSTNFSEGMPSNKGIKFEKIFTLVVNMISIRAIIGLSRKLDLEKEHIEAKTTFWMAT